MNNQFEPPAVAVAYGHEVANITRAKADTEELGERDNRAIDQAEAHAWPRATTSQPRASP